MEKENQLLDILKDGKTTFRCILRELTEMQDINVSGDEDVISTIPEEVYIGLTYTVILEDGTSFGGLCSQQEEDEIAKIHLSTCENFVTTPTWFNPANMNYETESEYRIRSITRNREILNSKIISEFIEKLPKQNTKKNTQKVIAPIDLVGEPIEIELKDGEITSILIDNKEKTQAHLGNLLAFDSCYGFHKFGNE